LLNQRKGNTLDTSKIYQDSEGNNCTIWQMIQREPDWAANRLQEGENAIERLATLEVQAFRNLLS